MKVVIIGSGNVATVIGRKMQAAGLEILQVISPNKATGRELAASLFSSYAGTLLEINKIADIYMIAVPDKTIPTVAQELTLNEKYVVHTAGSVSINALRQRGLSTCKLGVIYPLQTLNRKNPKVPAIPVLIDGDSQQTRLFLQEFCMQWADDQNFASDDERLKMHVAAVLSTNFTNYLFTITQQYCNAEALNFSMLLPLINETSSRLMPGKARDLQTGPAVRGDLETINSHLALLENYPEIRDVYRLLTSKIIEHFKS